MKTTLQVLSLLLLLLFTTRTPAQIFHDEKSDRKYSMTPNTDKKIVGAFLKQLKATAIEFNPHSGARFPFRLKNVKGNWMLFDSYREEVFMSKASRKYSFQFPSRVMDNIGITVANYKNEIYFVKLHGRGFVESKMAFDEIKPQLEYDTLMVEDSEGNPEEKYVERLSAFYVKKAGKWGLIEMADQNIYLSRNLLYSTQEEVPKATGFQSHQLEMMEQLRENHKIDLLIPLDTYGYYFKARKKRSKLFGVFAGEGEAINQIPAQYTDIKRHRNPLTFEVWKNGKVGYYNGNFELVLAPNYDDFKFVHLDYTYGCALKSKGKWELYDAYEAVKLVEGATDTIEELIELWLNR